MHTFLALFPAAISSHFISISLARTHIHAHLFTDGKLVLSSVHTNVYSRSHFVDENRLAHCMALQYYGMYVCHSLCADTIFLGRCTQTIKWKVKKANKQKLKWKTANTRHVHIMSMMTTKMTTTMMMIIWTSYMFVEFFSNETIV